VMATGRSRLAEIRCRAQLVCEAGWRRDLVGKRANAALPEKLDHAYSRELKGIVVLLATPYVAAYTLVMIRVSPQRARVACKRVM
jgi:hypothetical protein